MGGSNGGLLVGAVMEQRPDLFAVALPAVGVMDMLRYHKFTGGDAPGRPSTARPTTRAAFAYLFKYSPLHNVKPGTCYPATLVTTADHDDRVVPSHSFKFTATLQEAQACAEAGAHRGRNAGLARLPPDRQAHRRTRRRVGVRAGEYEAAHTVDAALIVSRAERGDRGAAVVDGLRDLAPCAPSGCRPPISPQ